MICQYVQDYKFVFALYSFTGLKDTTLNIVPLKICYFVTGKFGLYLINALIFSVMTLTFTLCTG